MDAKKELNWSEGFLAEGDRGPGLDTSRLRRERKPAGSGQSSALRAGLAVTDAGGRALSSLRSIKHTLGLVESSHRNMFAEVVLYSSFF